MRKIFLLLTFFYVPVSVFSQVNCDCIDAIELTKNFTDSLGTKGTGKFLELSDPDNKSVYWFEKEHNISWFRFQAKQAADLVLEIVPKNPNDDIDFALFKYDEEGFCDRITQKKGLPVRTNLARSSGVNNGITGMFRDAADDFVHSGLGNTTSKTLAVKKDDVLYLVIDNVTSEGKFSVKMNIVPEEKITDDAPKIASKDEVPFKTPFTIKVVDDATGSPVSANIDIAGYTIGEPFHASETFSCQVFFLSSQTITINCNASGYVFYTKKMYAPSIPYDVKENPPNVDFEIRLKKIKAGDNVTLPNFKFQGDETAFLPTSRPALFSLLRFMESNPAVRIEVGGHVNAPDMRNSAKLKKLSKDRAKAVKEYLTGKGIAEDRIEYKGYGNSKLIYKKPMNEQQSEENRRVEIRILSM